jgi:predicted transcriptional regulator
MSTNARRKLIQKATVTKNLLFHLDPISLNTSSQMEIPNSFSASGSDLEAQIKANLDTLNTNVKDIVVKRVRNANCVLINKSFEKLEEKMQHVSGYLVEMKNQVGALINTPIGVDRNYDALKSTVDDVSNNFFAITEYDHASTDYGSALDAGEDDLFVYKGDIPPVFNGSGFITAGDISGSIFFDDGYDLSRNALVSAFMNIDDVSGNINAVIDAIGQIGVDVDPSEKTQSTTEQCLLELYGALDRLASTSSVGLAYDSYMNTYNEDEVVDLMESFSELKSTIYNQLEKLVARNNY